MNVRGGLRIFSVYFWRSEEWSSRNEALLEAVLKRTRTTRHPWLIARDANMSPEDFEKSLWFRKDQMHVIAPAGVSTCRSKNAKGERVEKVYDSVKACSSLKGKISDMQVIEDFESRPHKAVTFIVEKAGVERAITAEDATRKQWRKATRKKHGRERQGERRKMRKKQTKEKTEKI